MKKYTISALMCLFFISSFLHHCFADETPLKMGKATASFENYKWGMSYDEVESCLINNGKLSEKSKPSQFTFGGPDIKPGSIPPLSKFLRYTDTLFGQTCSVVLSFTPKSKQLYRIDVRFDEDPAASFVKWKEAMTAQYDKPELLRGETREGFVWKYPNHSSDDEAVEVFLLYSEGLFYMNWSLSKLELREVKEQIMTYGMLGAKVRKGYLNSGGKTNLFGHPMTLLLLVMFSILAFAYLTYRESSALVLFSRETEGILTRVALGIFILTAFCGIFFWKRSSIFLWLMFFSPVPLLWYLWWEHLGGKKSYKIRSAPSSPDCWICMKCGEENHNILLVCHHCGSHRDQQKK